MKKDISWSIYFEKEERFADLVNACGCGGEQILHPCDIQTMDSKNIFRHQKAGKESIKYRDIIRKAALGINFAIIGLENQETVNYAMPLTCMTYDITEYEKQKRTISRIVHERNLYQTSGEYLYGFLKESRLYPVITFILYSGEEWDGPKELTDIINFREIPDSLKNLVQNYKVNLIEIRKLEDTSIFKTDIRQVFDFIRYSKNKEQLKMLVLKNPDYEKISKDAYDVIKKYTNIVELKNPKGEVINMCQAMQEWAADERAEGKREGKRQGRREGK